LRLQILIWKRKKMNKQNRSLKTNKKKLREGYKMVEIISDVPEFMGTDLESYGPFEER